MKAIADVAALGCNESMCNLYSQTNSQDAMRNLFRVVHDRTVN
jgi:hypothetical protein